ncbi:MAG: hypothetical protein WCX30_00035 [Candidatus Paceibacterota bacterium]|jgi:hypothetical protein|nr:hypothetical protein [bacterium]
MNNKISRLINIFPFLNVQNLLRKYELITAKERAIEFKTIIPNPEFIPKIKLIKFKLPKSIIVLAIPTIENLPAS